jgi:hypothetical protein
LVLFSVGFSVGCSVVVSKFKLFFDLWDFTPEILSFGGPARVLLFLELL